MTLHNGTNSSKTNRACAAASIALLALQSAIYAVAAFLSSAIEICAVAGCLAAFRAVLCAPWRIKNGGAFVKSSRVPRIAELEQVVVEVVAELVAQRAQKCAIRCDFLLSRSSHPQPYEHRRGVVVAEQFSHPFAAFKRSCCQHPDAAGWDLIEARGL